MITAMSKTLCCRHYLLASCPSGSKWPPRAFPKVAAKIETWVWGVVMLWMMMLMLAILTVSCLVFARNMIKIKISTTCYTLSSKSTGLVLCTVLILIFGSHHFLLFRSHALGTKSGSSTKEDFFATFVQCTLALPWSEGWRSDRLQNRPGADVADSPSYA